MEKSDLALLGGVMQMPKNDNKPSLFADELRGDLSVEVCGGNLGDAKNAIMLMLKNNRN